MAGTPQADVLIRYAKHMIRWKEDARMPDGTILLAVLAGLLGIATLLMLVIAWRLRSMQRELEAARRQLGTMDWGAMLFNGVQQLKGAVQALEQIDLRLQKLEAIEKVQLSHINVRAGH
jgi:cytochrome bd-type quinol oxidase subunit 1